MGKRYYCDYCDRSFIDDLEARKKHLNGSMHVRLRKEHYDFFRDARTVYAEESVKEPCKRFLRMGDCVFGANCRFTHLSEQQLQELKLQIEMDDGKLQEATAPPRDGASILDSWLKKRAQGQVSRELKPESKQVWELPPNLEDRPDLPPSLFPLSPDNFSGSEFEEWG